MDRYDFIVIGSGPAGQKAAIQAAIIERRMVVGGVSLHTGTMPSKTLREAVLYLTGGMQTRRKRRQHDFTPPSELTLTP